MLNDQFGRLFRLAEEADSLRCGLLAEAETHTAADLHAELVGYADDLRIEAFHQFGVDLTKPDALQSAARRLTEEKGVLLFRCATEFLDAVSIVAIFEKAIAGEPDPEDPDGKKLLLRLLRAASVHREVKLARRQGLPDALRTGSTFLSAAQVKRALRPTLAQSKSGKPMVQNGRLAAAQEMTSDEEWFSLTAEAIADTDTSSTYRRLFQMAAAALRRDTQIEAAPNRDEFYEDVSSGGADAAALAAQERLFALGQRAQLSSQERRCFEAALRDPDLLDHGNRHALAEAIGCSDNRASHVKASLLAKIRDAS